MTVIRRRSEHASRHHDLGTEAAEHASHHHGLGTVAEHASFHHGLQTGAIRGDAKWKQAPSPAMRLPVRTKERGFLPSLLVIPFITAFQGYAVAGALLEYAFAGPHFHIGAVEVEKKVSREYALAGLRVHIGAVEVEKKAFRWYVFAGPRRRRHIGAVEVEKGIPRVC